MLLSVLRCIGHPHPAITNSYPFKMSVVPRLRNPAVGDRKDYRQWSQVKGNDG